jgi:hypothetical protein
VSAKGSLTLTWINGGPAPSHETERPLGLNPEAAGTKRAPTAHVKKITQMAAAQSKKNHTIETHKSTSSRSIHPPEAKRNRANGLLREKLNNYPLLENLNAGTRCPRCARPVHNRNL